LNKIDTKYKGENLKFLKFQFKRNRIYANTVGGFFILDLKGNVLFKLNKSNGLVSNKIVDFSVSDKIIWINHLKGLQCFELKKIQIKPKPAKIIATKIQKENKISFTLQVPTLKNRENIFYHYKLLPLDKKWNLNQYNDNQIVYNALTPGDYEFIVRSENNGVFSKPKTYSFVVQAPFYQKWWFTSLVSIFVILLVISFYRSKLKKQELESQKMNELNASKLTAIQSQMNPHFIFNSLNSIQDLVLKGDINNSYTFITKFSNLIRRTLNYSDKDFIDFDQEIKLLELYLSLEKLRFKDEVEFNLNASGIDDIQVPPMLIQPFIENALIHGLLHKEGLKKIDILFKLDKQLICEITDNGVGRVKSAEIKNRQRSDHESFAIGAIKKRFEILEKYFNGALGFEYIDLMDGETVLGTKVILRIPIKHKF
jgi:hypothetical protein